TPRRNRDGGRDHYGNLTSLLLAGGGLKMGQVVGQSDKTAAQPVSTRYTPKDLLATVMHVLMHRGTVRLMTTLGRLAGAVSGGEGSPHPPRRPRRFWCRPRDRHQGDSARRSLLLRLLVRVRQPVQELVLDRLDQRLENPLLVVDLLQLLPQRVDVADALHLRQ